MSVNIRDYVSNDHVESIGEIAKSQSAIIQALSIDNSKLEQELERKDNIINKLEEKLIGVCETCYEDKETARIKKWIDKIKEIESE